jgi:PAS domain S-box-containing protein
MIETALPLMADLAAEGGVSGRSRERQFRELLDALPAALYTTDAEGRITFYNPAAAELWGRRPTVGDSRWCGSWRLFWPDGKPMRHDECPMAVALRENRSVRGAEAIAERPDGVRVPFIPYPTPLRDETGSLVGAVNMLVDITDRKRAEDRQKALVDELNHRVKNTLATVQSLAAQTLRGDAVPAEIRDAFDARLLALSRVHDHLSAHGWGDADFRRIVEGVFAPYQTDTDDRIIAEGGPVRLSSRQALALAMVLHEMATNAAKYGSLSNHAGRLSLAWGVIDGESGRMLEIRWQESGGPPVEEPEKTGFGSRLVLRAVNSELSGRVETRFDPSGFRCSIAVPL